LRHPDHGLIELEFSVFAVDGRPDLGMLVYNPVEFGAAWKKTSREDREYLSIKLDDPSFAAPIYASLVEAEDGEQRLIWSR